MSAIESVAGASELRAAEGSVRHATVRRLAPEQLLREEPELGQRTLAIASVLQSSLDVGRIVEMLSEEVASCVPHDHLEYRNDTEGLQVRLGRPYAYACTYALELLGNSLGFVTLSRGRPYRRSELDRLDVMLSALVYPLRNALLYRRAVETAHKDPVTGINNRGAFDATLEREVGLSRRHGVALALVMLDIDHFKRINDRHGHMAGDAVLKGIADCLTECIRSSDICFRVGGEEFAVVLSNTDLDGARQLAARIREAVAARTHLFDGLRLRVTVSLGVAALATGETPRSLLRRVDQALYAAKGAGRDRVEAV